MTPDPIVTLGEAMMVFNGPADAAIGVGSAVGATFAGAEANVAIGLARLGHAVRYLSVFGDDLFGRAIVGRLREEGVDVSRVQMSARHPTGVMFKNRRPVEEPEVFYYRSNSAFAQAEVETFDPALWRDAKLIYLSGITPALSPACLELFRHVIADAAGRGIPVWLDPNYRKKLWSAEAFRRALVEVLPDVDTILPGLSEGQLLTGKAEAGEIACMLMGMGAKNVILKSGGGRAVAYTQEGTASCDCFHIDRVVDPIGAGDGFAAGYLSGFLEGLPVAQRLERAHGVAAMVCLTVGDWEGLPTRGEIEQFVVEHRRG
jgi:2-dehydro-3-deoxygluconokinase